MECLPPHPILSFHALLLYPVSHLNGSQLVIERAGRLSMGAYLCIASNGIPPTVSKRIRLIVHCT